MNIVQAPRASAILYNVLKSQPDMRPWLLPANICPIVPVTFLKAGISFEFVDISARTLHMDLDRAEALLETRRFGGVLYAHTYGEASTPNEFFRRIRQIDEAITIIDDRCLCVPDLQPDADTQADVQLYSTGYAKIVDLGYGGYAFLNAETSYRPAHLPFKPADHDRIEHAYKQAIDAQSLFNYNDSDWLQTDAELPSWDEYNQLIQKDLERSLQHRTLLDGIYSHRLPVEIQLPNEYQTWRYNIRVKNKAQILKAIFEASLFASSHYASLAGIMAEGSCPGAELLSSEVINLFNNYHFDGQKAEQTCAIVLRHLS